MGYSLQHNEQLERVRDRIESMLSDYQALADYAHERGEDVAPALEARVALRKVRNYLDGVACE